MTNENPKHPVKAAIKFVGTVLVFMILLIMLWIILFGCEVQLGLPQQTEQAYQLWNSNHIEHYQEVFRVGGFCGFPCGNEISMEVQNNQIIRAEAHGSLIPNTPFEPVTTNQIVSGDLQSYTVDALFQRARTAVQNMRIVEIQTAGSQIYTLEYNSKLGFVSNFSVSVCGQGGLLGPKIGDCAWGVTVKSVDILD
jgi:hypothetical protein